MSKPSLVLDDLTDEPESLLDHTNSIYEGAMIPHAGDVIVVEAGNTPTTRAGEPYEVVRVLHFLPVKIVRIEVVRYGRKARPSRFLPLKEKEEINAG